MPLLPVALDVTDREAVLAAASQISEELGEIDVAIMNAAFWQQVMVDRGTRPWFPPPLRHQRDGDGAWDRGRTPPSMRRTRQGHDRGHGHSLAPGYRGFPRSEGYGPTKAALINMLEALRDRPHQPTGIEVITVCPGFVRTELTYPTTAFRCR